MSLKPTEIGRCVHEAPLLVFEYTTNNLYYVQREGHRDSVREEFDALNSYNRFWGSRNDLQVRVIRESENIQIIATLYSVPAGILLRIVIRGSEQTMEQTTRLPCTTPRS